MSRDKGNVAEREVAALIKGWWGTLEPKADFVRTCYEGGMGRPKGSGARPVEERFLEKVEKTAGCWLWTGLTNGKGYGRFGVSRERGMILAHRFAWEIGHGPLPDEACVLHQCDVPACVRLDHLFLGTRAVNNADMRAKGREAKTEFWKLLRPEQRARGERVAKAMTEEKVRSLRSEYAAGGTSFVKLGEVYGIAKTTVEAIVHRRKWAHVW